MVACRCGGGGSQILFGNYGALGNMALMMLEIAANKYCVQTSPLKRTLISFMGDGLVLGISASRQKLWR